MIDHVECYKGLSKLLLGIDKIIVRNCQNCHQILEIINDCKDPRHGMSSLLLGIVKNVIGVYQNFSEGL